MYGSSSDLSFPGFRYFGLKAECLGWGLGFRVQDLVFSVECLVLSV